MSIVNAIPAEAETCTTCERVPAPSEQQSVLANDADLIEATLAPFLLSEYAPLFALALALI